MQSRSAVLEGWKIWLHQLGAIQETVLPSVTKRAIIIMAGDHGVVEEGVTQTGQESDKIGDGKYDGHSVFDHTIRKNSTCGCDSGRCRDFFGSCFGPCMEEKGTLWNR